MPYLKHLTIPQYIVVAAALILSGAAAGQGAGADAYPSKPITLVVPLASGGPNDNEFRTFMPKLAESFSQPFVFDFKPGAGTTIGIGFVAKAATDGYTLLLTNGGYAVHPNFYPDLPYDILRSFDPVSQLTGRSTVMMVSVAALPGVHSIQDLIAHAKEHPDKLNCGTSGAGSITHIVCAALASAANIRITPVYYKGGSQSQIDLIAGRTQLAAGTLFNALPNIRTGKLRPIATLNPERSRVIPEVRTSIEQGYEVEFPDWLGVLAPAGTPGAVIARLNTEFRKAVLSPDVAKQLEQQGSIALASAPEAFRKRLSQEMTRWKKIIQERGIKAEE